jgi:TonB-linked SusC/RagA family outer membrane protein
MRRAWSIIGALLAVLWVVPLHAQESTGTVRGRVTEDATQRPLSGATVTIGIRSTRTQTDGSYTITQVPAGPDTVQARMLGYAPATRPVTVIAGQTVEVDLSLTPQAIGLSSIVVIGYGEQQAGNITGAVKEVTSAEFNTGRIVSPEQLIASKVAGVQVVDNNEPGGGISIRIRGATSINASSDPLYVIDGMPVGTGAGGGLGTNRNPLNFLNPEDIANITVLKDASAAAIYGANAANGVVLIQTKKGQGGPHLDYSGSASASTVAKLPDMLNATQFRAAVEQYAPQNVSQLQNANTDWFSLVDRTAFGQEHNVAVSGAGETMNYRLSGGYLNQKGILQGTTTERLSLGLNYEQRLLDDHLDLRTNVKGARTFDQFTPGGVLSNAAQMGPTQPSLDPSTPTGYYNWPGNTLQSPDNPLEILNLATDQGTTYRSVGNLQAEYSLPFLEALKANVNLGYDVSKADRETFNPSALHGQLKAGTGGTDYRTDQTLVNTVLETYLNYAATLKGLPGRIDLTGGYSYAQSHGVYPSLNLQGLSTDLLGTNGVPTANTVRNFLDIQDSKLISFFGRLNYNINDRYLAAFSIRRDGSSRFGPTNAWGTFPSVSLAWRLSDESVFRNWNALSDLKLRASWGKTGNQAFANYVQYGTYLVGDAAAQVQFGGQYVTTIRPGAYDPNIKWEATSSWDVGLDYGFGNQRFSGAIDWYVKNTSDLIFTVPVAAGTNLSNFVTTNIGSMRNRGIEFSLSARLLERGAGGLSWTADFNAGHNRNELVSINPRLVGASTQILVGGIAGGVGSRIQVLEAGSPINSFFVYEHKRDASGKPIYADENGDGTINEQDLYVDLDGDGQITVADRRAFHDPTPSWILSHSSYMTYGRFDMSFTLRAYLGNYVYNNVASNLGTYSEVTRASPYNLHASVLTTGFETPQYLSDYYVEDASFLRLDNITLGYTFNYRGQPWRLFGTVQNAFTLTGYSGVDPTAGLNGIDNNIYPRSRTFTGGLSVRF